MTADTGERFSDSLAVFQRLAAQFSKNFDAALLVSTTEIKRVELKSRCLSTVGELLRDKVATSETQKQIARVYDEIFSDCVCTIYLAAQGLDKPAQLVLRRVLELGLAAVYLWDQPHVFWGWKELDQDLNFNEILSYLSGEPYLRFIASENDPAAIIPALDLSLARSEYRSLSNTVHGKFCTFESPLADRFRHSDTDWKIHLGRLEAIQDLLLNVATMRFALVRAQLVIAQPQIVPHI